MAKNNKKKRPPPPSDETKAERFKRVATPRIVKALRVIRLIGNCTGSPYEYTEVQATKVISELLNAVTTLENQMKHKKSKQVGFAFDS